MATPKQTPNPFNNEKVREQIAQDIAKLTSGDTSSQPATPKDEPASPTPGQDNGKKQESAGATADVWRKQIPQEYHEVFQGLDGLDAASRDKILAALKKPLWQTADYTKKTQALSAKEKEMQATLAKYKMVDEIANKYGMSIEEYNQVSERFASMTQIPGAKVVIGDKEVWSSPIKAEPEPDFSTMTKDEIKAWSAQQAAKERAKIKAELEAAKEAELAPIREAQTKEKLHSVFSELVSARSDVSELEWTEAIKSANALKAQLNSTGELTREALEPILEFCVWANRGKGAVKATPKQTSIDAPTSPATPAPKKPIKNFLDAFQSAKAEKGLI